MITTEITLGYDDVPNITIGRAKTHNTRSIVFDFSALKEKYGDGEFSLLYVKPGETEERPESELTVPVIVTGNKATWIVTDTNTAHSGAGEAECIYRGNKFCYKSNVFHVIVGRDIND